jgi:hypothetical protein
MTLPACRLRSGRKITNGVYCSDKRTLTVVARAIAGNSACTRVFDRLRADVHQPASESPARS